MAGSKDGTAGSDDRGGDHEAGNENGTTSAPGNVVLCHRGAYAPGGYADRPPGWFVGRAVKAAFRAADGTAELMWVEVGAAEGGRLVGSLASEPLLVDHIKFGDRVELSPAHVLAVYG